MKGLRRLVTKVSPMLWRRRRGAIGIDISLSHLHMVQLCKNPDGTIRVVSSASIAHPCDRELLLATPVELKKQVRRALAAGEFKGRRAVLGLPASEFRTIPVNYRSVTGVSDDQMIASLMKERLDGPLNDYVIDYLPVRAQAQDAEKLAVVAVSSRKSVIGFLDAMRATGIIVEALEIGPVAIRRLANALPGPQSQMTLIINTGLSKSYLTLLSGRRLLMDQGIEFSESRLLAALAKELEMDAKGAREIVMRTGLHPQCGIRMTGHRQGETGIFNTLLEILKPELLRLVEEIDRAFMYAAAQARGGGDTRICLLGSLARWPGVDRVLAELLNLPLSALANPLAPFSDDESEFAEQATSAEPEFAIATGLALRGLCDDD